MLAITLDNLASRYHCLPSEAYARGNTIDLHILDVSTKWANHQRDVAEGKVTTPKISEAEMFKMMERVKKESENGSKNNH